MRASVRILSIVGSIGLTACGASRPSSEATSRPADVAPVDCTQAQDPFVCQCEQGIFSRANDMRREVGRPDLTFDTKITEVSRLWSEEQARRGDISHDWFIDGTWEAKYQQLFHEASTLAGENVAMNSGYDTAEECASSLSEQWRHSDGHYQNIIGNYDIIGVGVARTSQGYLYATQDFGR